MSHVNPRDQAKCSVIWIVPCWCQRSVLHGIKKNGKKISVSAVYISQIFMKLINFKRTSPSYSVFLFQKTFSRVKHTSHLRRGHGPTRRGHGSLTCHMAQFEKSDRLRSDNFIHNVIECTTSHSVNFLIWPSCTYLPIERYLQFFCEARRASHCHSPHTTYSSKSTCCAIPAKNSAMHVVVYAGRLTSQRSNVEIINW